MTDSPPPKRAFLDERTLRWGGLAALLIALNVAVWLRPKSSPPIPPPTSGQARTASNPAAYAEDDPALREDALPPRKRAILDVHEHAETEADVDRLVTAMDGLGIEMACVLAAPRATFDHAGAVRFDGFEENNEVVLRSKARHPGRICAFVTLHPGDEDNAERLTKYVERGADGLKLFLGHPGSAGKEPFHSMALDDPRMWPVFEYAEKIDLPVTMHVDFTRWGDELSRLLERFPKLRLNLPHFATSKNNADRLARLGKLLDTHEKVYLDVSFGHPDIQTADFETLAAAHKEMAEFMKAHAGRVMFASDLVVTSQSTDAFLTSTLRSYMLLLETDRFRFFLRPERPMWGLSLPEDVLRAVYRTAPAAFLKRPDAQAAPR